MISRKDDHLINNERDKRKFYLYEAGRRRIQQLAHFTRLENLASILDRGICPRDYLQANSLPFEWNDSRRYDGHTDASCLSVEFPNSQLFTKFRYQYGGVWVVLSLKPEVFLSESINEFHFYKGNAARNDLDRCRFSEMFGNSQTRFPEDEQAEILAFGTIDQKYIQLIFVESEEDETLLKNQGMDGIAYFPDMFKQRDLVI